MKIAAVTFFGCAVGLCWFWGFQQQYLAGAAALDGQQLQCDLTASSYSTATEYGTRVDARMEIDGKGYSLRVYLEEEKSVEPGDRLRGQFRFHYTAAYDQEALTYHPGKGIFLLAYQEDAVQLDPGQDRSWQHGPAMLAQKLKDLLAAFFPKDTETFAIALLLGDTQGLDYGTDTSLKLSGIRHVVAVSGLHVSILFGLISTMTFRNRYLTALFGLPLLFAFAAIGGFTPSVSRACIMSALMLLSRVINREYDGATALAFACLVMLCVNPMVITSVSFQLSAASVAGIYLLQPRIQTWLQGKFGNRKLPLLRWFTGSVSVSLSATALTAPLSALHFGAVSLVGALTNLLTLWLISLIFYGIMAVCLAGFFWNTGAAVLAEGISRLIRLVLRISGILGELPLAAVYTQSPYIVLWLVFCYVLLGAFVLSRKRSPGMLVCCGTVGLCVALLASWTEPAADSLRMTVLDVGQGQSILLQSEGRCYLVDCGGDSDTAAADLVAETLLSQGITRLDGIVLTHLDRDHAGAVHYLLERMEADMILLPDVPSAVSFGPVENGVYLDRDVIIAWGDTKITVYGPIYSGDSNENSLCVLLQSEKCDILITGDRSEFGERMLMRKTSLPDVDVLVAGHHGAEDSTSEELLRAVKPETVMISVGENAYGHPDQGLLERLEKFGCTVYRTDLHGTILFRR